MIKGGGYSRPRSARRPEPEQKRILNVQGETEYRGWPGGGKEGPAKLKRLPNAITRGNHDFR